MNTGRFRGYPIVSDQVGPGELGVVWRELQKVLQANIAGAVVEFGCYTGTTSLFIRRLLDESDQSASREFHVYDSFAGLPPKTSQDQSVAGDAFQAGELLTTKKDLLRNFHAAHLRPPIIHKAWFDQLSPEAVPPKMAFAFLDGDFYDSIRGSLKLVWPRLSPGGVVLVDDYGRDALPGPERAVHDFFQGCPPVITVEQNVAILVR